tara:strand:- start:16507 stop:17001 length:495 start_codon:yes stop_codon:yes gene_type:complete
VQAVPVLGTRLVQACGDREPLALVLGLESVFGDRELWDQVLELGSGDRERLRLRFQMNQRPNDRAQSAIDRHGVPTGWRCMSGPRVDVPNGRFATSTDCYATPNFPEPKEIHFEQRGSRIEVPVVVDQPRPWCRLRRVQRNSVPPIQRPGQARRLQTCCANSIS